MIAPSLGPCAERVRCPPSPSIAAKSPVSAGTSPDTPRPVPGAMTARAARTSAPAGTMGICAAPTGAARCSALRIAPTKPPHAAVIQRRQRPGDRGHVVDEQAAPGVAGSRDRAGIQDPAGVRDPSPAAGDRSRRGDPDCSEPLAHTRHVAPLLDGVFEARDGGRLNDVHRRRPGTPAQEPEPDVSSSEIDGERALHRDRAKTRSRHRTA